MRASERSTVSNTPDNPTMNLLSSRLSFTTSTALNHLAVSMVPSKNRSVAFPILWQGVWEDPIEGENKATQGPGAMGRTPAKCLLVARKGAQPPDLGPNVENTTARSPSQPTWNRDAHTKLMVVSLTCSIPRSGSRPQMGRSENTAASSASVRALVTAQKLKASPKMP